MTSQPEQLLENNLVNQLQMLGYKYVPISDESNLLANLKNSTDKEKKQKELIDLISGETQLRSKRELIEKFIKENLPNIEDSDNIPNEFERFWNEEQIIVEFHFQH